MSSTTTDAIQADESLPVTRLRPNTIQLIRESLINYRESAGGTEVALLDPTGAVLVREDGANRGTDLDNLAVLASASFVATKTLAQTLGDKSFGGICHQGRQNCLYVAPLVRGFMVLALFPADAQIGDLRQSLVRVVPRLNQLLVEPAPQKSEAIPA